jgi:DNA-binding response OmpR family regulator
VYPRVITVPRKGTRRPERESRPIVVFGASPAVRAAADKQLTAAGYAVITTSDAARLDTLVAASDPCLVVCEWPLPSGGGLAACPVILLTPAPRGPKKGDLSTDAIAGRVDLPLTGTRLAREVARVLADRGRAPVAKVDAPAAPDFASLPAALRTALVVDDSVFSRAFLKSQLVPHGFQVIEAGDGEEALELALAHHPWLIITDMQMPRMNGLELCRHVRGHSLIRHTPLVFLSDWDDYQHRDEALGAGADEYLSKDTSARELLIRVHLILSRFAALGRPSREGLRGAVGAIGMTGIFQMCHLAELTGILGVRSGLRTCEMRWLRGEIVAAVLSPMEGEEAVYEVLGWSRGHFEFRPGDTTDDLPPLGGNFDRLLLQGCRRLDERRAGRGQEPGEPASILD